MSQDNSDSFGCGVRLAKKAQDLDDGTYQTNVIIKLVLKNG